MKKSLYIKIMSIGLLAIVILAGWIFDSLRAKQFDIEIIYVSDTTPYANQRDIVTIEVQVTHNGVPCVGHEVEVRCDKGRFDSGALVVTDENGCATFEYVPYDESEWEKAGPVEFTFLELSNSIFIEVNVIKKLVLLEVQSLG